METGSFLRIRDVFPCKTKLPLDVLSLSRNFKALIVLLV